MHPQLEDMAMSADAIQSECTRLNMDSPTTPTGSYSADSHTLTVLHAAEVGHSSMDELPSPVGATQANSGQYSGLAPMDDTDDEDEGEAGQLVEGRSSGPPSPVTEATDKSKHVFGGR